MVTIRDVVEDDWTAMTRLGATCFGSFKDPGSLAAWRPMMPAGAAVVATDGEDGRDIVGMAMYLDLQLTVPGGAILPMAGMTWVAVAPTHRRRGVLRAMYTELHGRIIDARYPVAGLLASEAGIYGRFGYGPATLEHHVRVDRRNAHFHPDVPDAGGVRVIEPAAHRDDLAAVYERWRLQRPGGLNCPTGLWDEVLADRESNRWGGSQLMALLHPDGLVLYRVHHGDDTQSVKVTDFYALTDEAHIALWRVLIGMDLMDTVSATTYPADPLPYLLTDPRLARITSTEDGLWLRMIDIPAVLEARAYLGDLSVVLDVGDGFLRSAGRYALSITDGRATCVPTDAAADVHLDVSVLGSLYFGVHRASTLAAAHRLGCTDSGLLNALDAAFGSEVPAHLGYGF